jgi:dimethylglycine dehydrogenase
VFEEVYGFERPRWFARMASNSAITTFRRTVVDDMVAPRCKAVRERAGIMDISAFTKVWSRAGRLSAARPADRQPDAAENRRHHADPHAQPPRRIELETTIVRMARTASTWSARPSSSSACSTIWPPIAGARRDRHNRSSDWAALALQRTEGARHSGACTDARLDNAAFRWLSAQEIEIAGHRSGPSHVLCGELGLGIAHAARACRPSTTRSGRQGRRMASPITAASP